MSKSDLQYTTINIDHLSVDLILYVKKSIHYLIEWRKPRRKYYVKALFVHSSLYNLAKRFLYIIYVWSNLIWLKSLIYSNFFLISTDLHEIETLNKLIVSIVSAHHKVRAVYDN